MNFHGLDQEGIKKAVKDILINYSDSAEKSKLL